MSPSLAPLALLQAVVLALVASWTASRSIHPTLVLGLAAVAQLVAAIALLLRWERRTPLLLGIAAALTLLSYAFLMGLVLQVLVYVERHFGDDPAGQAWSLVGGLLAAGPWFLVVPSIQLHGLRARRRLGNLPLVSGLLLLLLVIVLPPLALRVQDRPRQRYAEIDGERVAAALLARVRGQEAPLSIGSPQGPVLLVAATLEKGRIVQKASSQANDLDSAIAALGLRSQPEAEALYLDVGLESGRLVAPLLGTPGVALLYPAESGLVVKDRVIGSLELWRKRAITSWAPLPSLRLPGIGLRNFQREGPIGQVRLRSWLATPEGVSPIRQTWAAPPEHSADALRDAALAGARFIAANQGEDGRYAYTVSGPDGAYDKGYNYPRHAGATWFLARVARRTQDPEVARAALVGLRYLGEHSKFLDDGRAHVLDPARSDGRAWVGTTALALLAAIELGAEPELQQGYARQVASAVDAQGLVRGDMVQKTGLWMENKRVSYAQGQGMLALAAATRAGMPGMREALERSAEFVEGGYWPISGGGRLFTLDEHWACLASLATTEALGHEVGLELCESYLDMNRVMRAPLQGALLPVVGAEAGLAEAVVARAELDRRGFGETPSDQGSYWTRWALEFGPAFLANLYQPADAPLLGQPERLIGGFRDRPWVLDVRVDAVQHIGCALLGIEQLLRAAPLPGGMP